MSCQVYQELEARGLIYQSTNAASLQELLQKSSQPFYIGFDPTADSLHVGSLIPIIVMMHLQRAGHRPIAILGGGTAMVGDPSGKTELRQMLTPEKIVENGQGIAAQLARFLDFNDDRCRLINNADWLSSLKYVDFLRDIGRHFSVNRMITAESYKQRLETGLSFIEFNYMILQAYDFHVLCQEQECRIQMGGQDQWGNIVAGIDLIRRTQGVEAYGVTFPLLTTSNGEKFGKTAAGAVWLSSARTSVLDFYQFWRNCEDSEIKRLLNFFTFLPVAEIKSLSSLTDQGINRAKEILAYEVTALVHGHKAAATAYQTAVSRFGCADPELKIKTSSEIRKITLTKEKEELPTLELNRNQFNAGMTLVDLFIMTGLSKSKGQTRRLIDQGGAYLNEERIKEDRLLIEADFNAQKLILRAGKKRFHQISLK
ncbi:MAG: tyrosine--tRNA ligase [Deltaproteobacteria bacterium]|nr:MAG: tyrosine--tRNA ligase [Deltaproteobacteria bacterium]